MQDDDGQTYHTRVQHVVLGVHTSHFTFNSSLILHSIHSSFFIQFIRRRRRRRKLPTTNDDDDDDDDDALKSAKSKMLSNVGISLLYS